MVVLSVNKLVDASVERLSVLEFSQIEIFVFQRIVESFHWGISIRESGLTHTYVNMVLFT